MTRTGRILAALPVVGIMAFAPAAANADYYRHYGYGGGYGYRGGYGYPGGYYNRGFGPGAVVGGALLGLGVGALIAGQPRYYAPPPVVYVPPPVVYTPPPAYYAPPYYAPPYYAPGYYPRY